MTIFHKHLQVLRIVIRTQRGFQRMETQLQINMLEAKLNITKNRVIDVVSHDDDRSYTRPVYCNTKRNNFRPICR